MKSQKWLCVSSWNRTGNLLLVYCDCLNWRQRHRATGYIWIFLNDNLTKLQNENKDEQKLLQLIKFWGWPKSVGHIVCESWMSIQIHFVKLVVFHRVNDKSDLPVALDEKALSSIKLLEFILWESINSHLNIQSNSINKTLSDQRLVWLSRKQSGISILTVKELVSLQLKTLATVLPECFILIESG